MSEKIMLHADGTAEFSNAAEAEKFLLNVKNDAKMLVSELINIAELKRGDVLVIGCSSSEITGNKIGKASIPSVADAILDGILPVVREKGIFLAAQCCEHLNRAIVIERALLESKNLDEVSVRPMPKAGGSFAAACFDRFDSPAVVEHIKANAGIDIGGTLIGMHLKEVAVPVRLSLSRLGEANIIAARTRPKYIGGARAVYN